MEDDLNTDFDLIVLGTGLVESLIAAAAARIGKKVLHLDRNAYYGGQWASFSLSGLENWISSLNSVIDDQDTGIGFKNTLEDKESWISLSNPNSLYHSVKYEYSQFFSEACLPTGTEEPKSRIPINVDGSEEQEGEEDVLSNETVKESQEEEHSKIKKWTKEEFCDQSRKFNIDLAPKLLLSRGPMVELLISSNVARYLEFKCLSRVLTWMTDPVERLVTVPCSRSDVYTTNVISRIEKFLLMRFQEHKDQWEDFADRPFKEFLVQQKLTPTLIHFVTKAIAMVSEDVSCSEGIRKTNLFLNSLGRYGSMPFLFSLYGSGEMPQAFCRLCAVFEGVYMLRKGVEGMVLDREKRVSSLVSEGQRFKCRNVVMEAGYFPRDSDHEVSNRKSISRGVLVTDRSILGGEKENVTLLKIPSDNGIDVTVLEIGPATGVCPKNTFLVHLTCEGKDAENDLRMIVERHFNVDPTSNEELKPIILFHLYFNRILDSINRSDLPSNLYVCSGPDAELDYDFSIEQARSIFSSIFPDEEFLPRAPDPEEIIFDCDSQETPTMEVDQSKDAEMEETNETTTDVAEVANSSAEITDCYPP